MHRWVSIFFIFSVCCACRWYLIPRDLSEVRFSCVISSFCYLQNIKFFLPHLWVISFRGLIIVVLPGQVCPFTFHWMGYEWCCAILGFANIFITFFILFYFSPLERTVVEAVIFLYSVLSACAQREVTFLQETLSSIITIVFFYFLTAYQDAKMSQWGKLSHSLYLQRYA